MGKLRLIVKKCRQHAGSQLVKISSAAQVDVIGPFLDQPGPHTESLCLTANSKSRTCVLKTNAKKDIIHFDVVNYFVLTPECGPA